MSNEISKGKCIFWKNNKVHFINPEVGYSSVMAMDTRVREFMYCPCLDTAVHRSHSARYGHFMEHTNWGYAWEDTPFNDFPPEFKATLLLLDIQ